MDFKIWKHLFFLKNSPSKGAWVVIGEVSWVVVGFGDLVLSSMVVTEGLGDSEVVAVEMKLVVFLIKNCYYLKKPTAW